MAKILYAIQAEGMGHSTRSKAIIDELCKEHEIIVIGGDNAYNLFYHHKDRIAGLEKIATLRICYRNNKVSTIGTFLTNIVKAPYHISSFFRIMKMIKEQKTDFIITDFEHLSCYAGNLKGIPVLSLDNEHVISKYCISFKKKNYIDYLKSRAVIKFIIPYANKYLVTSFFYPLSKSKKAEVFAPILRKDVLELKPKQGEHVLVYQTSKTSRSLLDSLAKVNENFIVYGFGRDEVRGNMRFKKFDEKGFFDDLASSKAVIMNGGLSLMTESIYLGKPILSVPVRKQFEQMLNSYQLDKLGIGMAAEDYSPEVITAFLENCDKYRKKLTRYKVCGNKVALRKINRFIANVKISNKTK